MRMLAATGLLALIPPAAWSMGALIFPGSEEGPARGALSISEIATRALIAYAAVLGSIAFFALALWLIAPMYRVERSVRRCVAVSLVASIPLMLGGLALMHATEAVLWLVAAMHGLYVAYLGAIHTLGVKPSEAPEFIAIAVIVQGAALFAAGAWMGAKAWI
jgi:hypothetical protein